MSTSPGGVSHTFGYLEKRGGVISVRCEGGSEANRWMHYLFGSTNELKRKKEILRKESFC